MRPLLEEQETIVRIDRISNRAVVYTSDTNMMKKLAKYREKLGTEWKLVAEEYSGEDTVSQTYECPKYLIAFRAKKRVMTEEQKKAASERLLKMRGENK